MIFGALLLFGVGAVWLLRPSFNPQQITAPILPINIPPSCGYKTVATEGQKFTLPRDMVVRYGAVSGGTGKWFEKALGAGTQYTCSPTTFGGDPYFGVVKQCQAQL